MYVLYGLSQDCWLITQIICTIYYILIVCLVWLGVCLRLKLQVRWWFLNDSNQESSVVTVPGTLSSIFILFNLFWWMTQRTREHAWLSVCCSSNAKWSTLTEGRMWLDRTSPHLILCLREQKALPPQESYCHHAWLSVCRNSHVRRTSATEARMWLDRTNITRCDTLSKGVWSRSVTAFWLGFVWHWSYKWGDGS